MTIEIKRTTTAHVTLYSTPPRFNPSLLRIEHEKVFPVNVERNWFERLEPMLRASRTRMVFVCLFVCLGQTSSKNPLHSNLN